MKALITTLLVLLSCSSITGQFTYFEEYAPFEEWEQAAGGIQIEISEEGYSIVCSPDAGNGYGFAILEIDNNADVESSHFFETGGLSASASPETFFKTTDGGVIYAGDESLRQWIVKFDENNSIEWEYFFPYNFEEDEIFSSIIELSDGFLFTGAMSISEGAVDNSLILFKTSLEGDSLWFKEIDSQNLFLNSLESIIILNDNHFLISGADGTIHERYLMKVDLEGVLVDLESNFHFYNEQESIQAESKMIQANSGNAVVAFARTDEDSWNGQGSSGNNYQFAILEFDGENMEVINEVTYPTLYEDHFIQDFHQTPDGGYAILGIHGNGLPRTFIKKVNANLEEEWMKYYEADIPSEIVSFADDFEITSDGGFICSGTAAGSDIQNYPQNIWLLKLDACGDREDLGCEFIDDVSEISESEFSVYPNPAQSKFKFELAASLVNTSPSVSIRNTLGQEVLSQIIGASATEIDVSSIPLGIYMVSLVSDGRELYSQRLVLE